MRKLMIIGGGLLFASSVARLYGADVILIDAETKTLDIYDIKYDELKLESAQLKEQFIAALPTSDYYPVEKPVKEISTDLKYRARNQKARHQVARHCNTHLITRGAKRGK